MQILLPLLQFQKATFRLQVLMLDLENPFSFFFARLFTFPIKCDVYLETHSFIQETKWIATRRRCGCGNVEVVVQSQQSKHIYNLIVLRSQFLGSGLLWGTGSDVCREMSQCGVQWCDCEVTRRILLFSFPLPFARCVGWMSVIWPFRLNSHCKRSDMHRI